MLDISVLIATRNRAVLLDETLTHFSALHTGALSWEVIVVDNGSTDHTFDVLRAHSQRLPLVILSEPRPGKNRALNRALAIAKGQLLVFTDDDVIPERSWLAELHAASLRWPQDGIFGGQIVPHFPQGTPGWVRDLRERDAMCAFAAYSPTNREEYTEYEPFGGNMAIRASRFSDVRFNEDIGPTVGQYAMGSETELLFRLRNRGERAVMVPRAIVKHVIRTDEIALKALYRRAYRSGQGRARLSELRPYRSKTRLFVGAPLSRWWELLEEWLQHARYLFSDDCTRFHKSKRFYFLWGLLSEHWRMRVCREGRKKATKC